MKGNLTREIRVDFYKDSGKWYSGGKVKVSHHLFEEEFKQDIVDNQSILHDGWQGRFIVVTDNIGDDPYFAKAVFHLGEFSGVKKS